MGASPAIVVVAFNRADSLKRLLCSLAQGNYEGHDVTLVISIDRSSVFEVAEVANEFEWNAGKKRVLNREQHLGLKEHVLLCGDLALEYGAIVMLEDDLVVSPHFYAYAVSAVEYYRNDAQIAGISLYNYHVSENGFYPFKAIDDGSDVYFMQVASSWGQIWTSSQWSSFRSWLTENPVLSDNSQIPTYLREWGSQSWKKHFIHHLIDADRYFVFPRFSLSTNLGEPGTNATNGNIYNVPLQSSAIEPHFQTFDKSGAIYDPWFEIRPGCLNKHCKMLQQYEYSVDLYGTKEIYTIRTKYVLTTQKAQNPLLSFSWDLFPLENNLALNMDGKRISLFEITNNSFSRQKLELWNYLEILNRKRKFGISIVIPLPFFDESLLRKSLQSIADQKLELIECLIICSVEMHASVRTLLKESTYSFKLIDAESNESLLASFKRGVEQASFEIVTWINAGTVFSENTLGLVSQLFETHQQITWVRGITESIGSERDFAAMDVTKYRLNLSIALHLAKKKRLYESFELNFIMRFHLLEELNAEKRSLPDLFLGLIAKKILTVCVYNFGESGFKTPSIRMTEQELGAILLKYQKSGKNFNFMSFLRKKGRLLLFFGAKSLKMLHFLQNDFNDILRFDPHHQTFYFSKK